MKMDVPSGMNIYSAARLAIEQSCDYNERVCFMFNDINLTVCHDSCVEDIYTIYELRCKIRSFESFD